MKPLEAAPKLARVLSLSSATILVVSVVVGSGVFKKVAPMSAELQSPGLVLACWLLAGLVSLAGALTNAEMAGMFPQSGGEYVYYRQVYNRFFAFLYGWGSFTVMRTAAIAALAHIFAQSLTGLLPGAWHTETFIQILATLLIIALSAINYRGIRFAEGLSRLLTYTVFLAIAGLSLAGFSSSVGSLDHVTEASRTFDAERLQGLGLVKAMVIASLGAFWGYDGWNQIGYIGEEIKEPQRNLPLALTFGTLIVIGIYMLLNLTYVYVLPIDELMALNQQTGQIAAVEVIRRVGGTMGAALVSGLILLTTFNATNSSILMSARVFYAMARDGLFFKSAAQVHPHYRSPSVAIVWQGVWSVGLVWSGSFDQLTDMLVFATFIFYGATALGVLILRRTQPDRPRPYRVVGYPVIPILFCLFCLVLVVVTLIGQPREALFGLGLIATGIPCYWIWGRQTN